MKMGLCWMLMVLLGCSFCQATPSERSCNDESIIYFVPENGDIHVLVPCPNVTGEVLEFYLRKDHEVIYSDTYREISHVKLDKDRENKTVGFILTKATNKSQGIYNCTAMRTFPPPIIEEPGQEILLLDERFRFQRCQHKNNNSSSSSRSSSSNIIPEIQDSTEIQSYPWIWITVVSLLSTYSLVVTVLALVNWMKLKKTDCQSDYINTKPRAPRGNKKKRGVQIPIPRYF